jgi:hypothetical protein
MAIYVNRPALSDSFTPESFIHKWVKTVHHPASLVALMLVHPTMLFLGFALPFGGCISSAGGAVGLGLRRLHGTPRRVVFDQSGFG